MSLRIRRGSETERTAIRFDQGELVWVQSTTTSRPAYKLYVGDGVTNGGKDIIESSVGSKLLYNAGTGRIDLDLSSGSRLNTDDIVQLNGANNQFFTAELVQDVVGAMVAGGAKTGIQVVYQDNGTGNGVLNFTVTGGGAGTGTGIEHLYDDPAPQLGGDLNLNNFKISGIGDIDIDGYAIITGTLAVPAGMNSDIPLNGFDITGAGNITIGGDASFTGSISSQTGLGANLVLNTYNLTGLGNIDITGNLSVSGLGKNLDLNTHNITGTGNISNTGNVDVTGTIKTAIGLGGDLSLNNFDITGTGDVNITGDVTATNIISDTFTPVLVGGGLNLEASTLFPVKVSGLSSNSSPMMIELAASGGTVVTPTALSAGDFISGVKMTGYYGGNYVFGAGLITKFDNSADFTKTFPKSTMFFVTNNNTNSQAGSASLDGDGVFTANSIRPGVYATSIARDTAIPVPANGMMVYITAGNALQCYSDGSWKTVTLV